MQERNSTDFLTACSRGDLKAIFHLIKKNDVNVNICDAKGNNGVFFAAINNRLDVIRVLVNLGAKLNQENDEGLLPLSMCLLIYLSQKYEVGSWENSFLPKVQPVTEPKDAHKWYPNVSILDLPSNKEKHVSKKKFKKYSSESKEYIFDMSFVTPTETKEASDTVYKPIPTRNTVDTKINDDSIKTLLKYGANPNAGGSPLPTLILSLFTQVSSLVEAILDAGADANVAIENNVTSLHVMTSSKCTRANVNICQLLIMHNCDPKLKTSTNHWLKQKMEILGMFS